MSTDFPYILTNHARKRIMQRGISLDWIVRVLENPDHEQPDAEDPELFKAWGYIPELGNRVLCVVYNETSTPWRIVTAYFDRAPWDR
ncbi:hypothetical protein C7Y66_21130 [Chroococcidiopsis sp. CCALA 051]|uniref:DUF4258 domain-containing protein n=1 Tax=Chroococcidiopsis sp. CCALA 051 TaxID=869949 RepID=UPI000D0D51B4|nr:DUF4258 domain-containing protein [Chroococcidiopsis sp. CCALA 051]PSM47183.1 hypothetical protein C7Y66_21130 [Chroococcidiopsis sp. CCALA 051]